MTEADSDEDEECDPDGRSDFVFDPVDTDNEDKNVVDAPARNGTISAANVEG